MTFFFTPDEAQSTALSVIEHFEQLGVILKIEEKIWEDAPLRTTLSGKVGELVKLIEVQSEINYENVQGLALWMRANRHYAELYLAVSSNAISKLQTISKLKKDGIGLLLVDENRNVEQDFEAKIPALIVTPDPLLKYGKLKAEVIRIVEKFNNVDRKDGLRDMCELVERQTRELIAKASRKGYLKMPEAQVIQKDWSTQIDHLSNQREYNIGFPTLFDPKVKNDMHSFRGARNLFDHPPKNKREDMRMQKQFAERMMQGPRLCAELVSLQRKVK